MTKPDSPLAGTVFDLATAERELRAENAYAHSGHAARTLIIEQDLRIVLVVLRGGSRIREHRADETASIYGLSGHLRLNVNDKVLELRGGQLLVLQGGLRHDVEAEVDSAFLLTLGWRKAT